MTLKVLKRLRSAGFGLGRRERYNPWIRIRRALSSPVSNQQKIHLPLIPRPLHLLSRLEGLYALLAAFLGSVEIREQFPTHAEPALHPGFDPDYQFPIANSKCELPGLEDIAKQEGIDPGVYPGTAITFVMTTDLVLTVKDGVKYKLVYWPVKPLSDLEGKKGIRRRERLRLEQRRAADVGAFFHVMTDRLVGRLFDDNLRAYKPVASRVVELDGTDTLLRFAETFNKCRGATLHAAWREAGAVVGRPAVRDAREVFNVALYRGLLDVSLASVMTPGSQVVWGGFDLRTRLRQQLFGVAE